MYLADFCDESFFTERDAREESRIARSNLNKEMMGYYSNRKSLGDESEAAKQLPNHFERLISEAERAKVSTALIKAARKILDVQRRSTSSPLEEDEAHEGAEPEPEDPNSPTMSPPARRSSVARKLVERRLTGPSIVLPINPAVNDSVDVILSMRELDGIPAVSIRLLWCAASHRQPEPAPHRVLRLEPPLLTPC